MKTTKRFVLAAFIVGALGAAGSNAWAQTDPAAPPPDSAPAAATPGETPQPKLVIEPAKLSFSKSGDERTVTIVGRPEHGMPDWRGSVQGRPMTSTEIADVVAWLAAQRVPFAGQPYLSRR